MKKKLLIAGLLGLVLSMNSVPNNVSTESLLEAGNDKLDVLNKGVSIKKLPTEEEVAYSQTFVQYAKKDANYYLRFATAVKGNINSLSYTRAITPVEGDDLVASKTVDVNFVYKTITAEGVQYYYNGQDIVTTESEESKNYYWACYTIKFADETYYDSPISVNLSIDGEALPTKTATLRELIADVTIDDLSTFRFEAENLNTENAILRPDFANAGRGFIESGAGASAGKNLCGYVPGSKFQITLNVLEDADLYITSSMSDTNLGYNLNEALVVKMDDKVLPTVNDVVFTYSGGNDYWNWKDVIYGKVSLTKGVHYLTIDAISQRPNLDYFEFTALKYGDKEVEKTITSLEVVEMPTKLEYEENEMFDKTGLVVKANYSNYSSEIITDYTIDKEGTPLTISDEKVVISYQGVSTEIEITVGKAYQLKLNSLGDHVFEAEDLKVDENWKMRQDMANAGHTTYVVNSAGSSGGKSIERYDVGTKFTLEFYATKDMTLRLTSTISNYDNFNLNDKIKFKIDGETTLNSDNPTFGHRYGNDWYNWQTAFFDPIELTEGEHVFTVELGVHANFDCFNFHIMKFGDQVEPHTLTSASVATMPTKTKYIVGECFDPAGLKLRLNYTDSLYEISEEFECDTTTPLTEGTTSVQVKVGEFTVNVPVEVKKIDAFISESAVLKIEGEDFDKSKLSHNGNGFVETPANASGGKCLGNGSNGSVEWTYELTKNMTLDIEASICKYEAVQVKTNFKVFVDGVEITLVNPEMTLGGVEGNLWFNFKQPKWVSQNLTAGTHSIRIELVCNVDYVQFSFTEA